MVKLSVWSEFSHLRIIFSPVVYLMLEIFNCCNTYRVLCVGLCLYRYLLGEIGESLFTSFIGTKQYKI
ncbi:hypothetical protein Hanom_Chr12g01156051 [Helianthus anomalus]